MTADLLSHQSCRIERRSSTRANDVRGQSTYSYQHWAPWALVISKFRPRMSRIELSRSQYRNINSTRANLYWMLTRYNIHCVPHRDCSSERFCTRKPERYYQFRIARQTTPTPGAACHRQTRYVKSLTYFGCRANLEHVTELSRLLLRRSPRIKVRQTHIHTITSTLETKTQRCVQPSSSFHFQHIFSPQVCYIFIVC